MPLYILLKLFAIVLYSFVVVQVNRGMEKCVAVAPSTGEGLNSQAPALQCASMVTIWVLSGSTTSSFEESEVFCLACLGPVCEKQLSTAQRGDALQRNAPGE